VNALVFKFGISGAKKRLDNYYKLRRLLGKLKYYKRVNDDEKLQ